MLVPFCIEKLSLIFFSLFLRSISICLTDCSDKLGAMTLTWRCLQFTADTWKFAIKTHSSVCFTQIIQFRQFILFNLYFLLNTIYNGHMEICNQNSQRTLYTAILYEITTIGSGIIHSFILSSESCSLILFFLVNIFWFQNIPSQDKNSIPQKKSLHFSYFRRWHLSVKPGWPARKMEFWLILFVPSASLYHHQASTSTMPVPPLL